MNLDSALNQLLDPVDVAFALVVVRPGETPEAARDRVLGNLVLGRDGCLLTINTSHLPGASRMAAATPLSAPMPAGEDVMPIASAVDGDAVTLKAAGDSALTAFGAYLLALQRRAESADSDHLVFGAIR